jgi:lysophospholipase L1-like esterase
MILQIKNIAFWIFPVFGSINAASQVNANFEKGLTGWMLIGNKANISIDHQNTFNGKSCIRIGPGPAGLEQRMETLPLSIVQFSFEIKSTLPQMKGYSFVHFFDNRGHLLLEYKTDPVFGSEYQETGIYTESPPGTRYSTVGFCNDSSGSGYIYADCLKTNLGAGTLKSPEPNCNLDQYLIPFWKSDIIYNETVLMLASDGNPATGRLLFTPDKILSVKDFALDKEYLPGKDYSVNGNSITMNPHSDMPFRTDTSFDRNTNLAWFSLQSQWIVVTYKHQDTWRGPVPSFKGGQMPNTMAKLNSKTPIIIVAYGMSITRGMDVSGFDSISPFMPSYADLFAYQIRKKFKYTDIAFFNAGLPGATVDWGAKYVETYINPLNPDLVILDFGMNDFWKLTPEQFSGYIQTIMNKVREGNHNVEFLLLSNMLFDPDYILDSDKTKNWYLANMKGYNIKLQELEKPGVIDLDMTTLSEFIYRNKKAKDCLANPLHPNDYLARWYAQSMVALFDEQDQTLSAK